MNSIYLGLYQAITITSFQLFSGLLLIPLYIIEGKINSIVSRIDYNYVKTIGINIVSQIICIASAISLNQRPADEFQSFTSFLLMFTLTDLLQVIVHKLSHMLSLDLHKKHHSVSAKSLWSFDHFYSHPIDIAVSTNLPVVIGFICLSDTTCNKMFKFALMLVTKTMNQHSGFFPNDTHYRHHEYKNVSFAMGGIFDNLVSDLTLIEKLRAIISRSLVLYIFHVFHEQLTYSNIIALTTIAIYVKYILSRSNSIVKHKYDAFNRTVRSSIFWESFYKVIGLFFPQSKEILFMNWGYDFDIDGDKLHNLDKYKEDMYYQTIDNALDNNAVKNVLEVGCGNGGGLTMLALKCPNIQFTGVDLNDNSIKRIKQMRLNNVTSFVDSAELLTNCENNFYDVVLNVESSHCYNNVSEFYKQVYNKLKPNGIFVYSDYSTTQSWDLIEKDILSKGFQLVSRRDVTNNVCSASRKMSVYYENSFKYVRNLPLLNNIFNNFSNNPKSTSYQRFATGKYKYMTYKFKKI